jgi:hypothetical protein
MTGTLREAVRTFIKVYRWIILKNWDVSDKSRRDQNTHFILNKLIFFWKSRHFWDNVEKYGTAEETTDDKWHGACALHAG